MTSKPIAIDAFCGAGGLSIGLANAGFKIIGGFDIDTHCIETLHRNPRLIHHPAIHIDVKSLLNGNWKNFFDIEPGQLDLLAGGPPCQGFSLQRTVGGDEDERNLLVDDYGDLICELLPKFFLLENVPGIGGKRGQKIMEAFKARMTLKGYLLHENVVDARNFQVPQRRRRYILIGEYSKIPKFAWPSPNESKEVTVREAIGHLPRAEKDSQDIMHRSDRLSDINLKRIRYLQPGQSRIDLPTELLADCHLLDAAKIGHRNVYGRMAWDEVAPTITARFDSFTRGKFGHPEEDRSISLLEGALLQSFPEGYIFSGNKVEIARQIGNAVPPLLAERLGEGIIAAL